MVYTVSQWLLIFFAYSFLGWVWECCFVSIKRHECVNRGFFYGPVIPIYGFGAIIILWLTLPVRDRWVLVYILGMLGATLLELVVGAMMERIFHMRWWDYSNVPLNIKGYVCLPCSLGWGVFSLFLVYVLHPPVERLLLRIPDNVGQIAADVFLVVFAADGMKSVQSALELRELLDRLREGGEKLLALEKRLAGVIHEGSSELHDRTAEVRQALVNEADGRKLALEELFRQRRERDMAHLRLLSDKARAALDEVERRLSRGEENLAERRQELSKDLDELEHTKLQLGWLRERDLRKAAGILKRNPTATSHLNRDVLKRLREMINKSGK